MAEHQFETVLLDIDALAVNPQNVNQGDVGAVMTAIAVDGWHGAVIAQARQGVPKIIAGHTRREALALLQQKGIDLPDGHRSYDDLLRDETILLPPAGKIPVQVLTVDDLRSLRKMVADNQSAALAITDEIGLGELLTMFAEQDALLGSLYDGDDVDGLLAKLGALDAPPNLNPEIGSRVVTPEAMAAAKAILEKQYKEAAEQRQREVVCPKCAHLFEVLG